MEAVEFFREGQLLLMKGNQRESIESFTKALDAGFDPGTTHLSRGVAHLQIKEFSSAIEDFTKAFEANPKNPKPYYYRGILHMIIEEYERAVSDFTSAIELNPELGQAVFARGTSYAQLGRDVEAMRDLESAIQQSETMIQGFVDTYGIQRTLFDKALALLHADSRLSRADIPEKEREKLQKFLQED